MGGSRYVGIGGVGHSSRHGVVSVLTVVELGIVGVLTVVGLSAYSPSSMEEGEKWWVA